MYVLTRIIFSDILENEKMSFEVIMYILSLDATAKTAAAAVCIYNDGKLSISSQCAFNTALTHSESLLPMVDFCLKGAGISLEEIELAAISAGPGSFTGVRIGISLLKGLCFSKKIKCVPVSALNALALNADYYAPDTIICPCMDARRNQFYNALFLCRENGKLERLCEDRAIGADELYNELAVKYGTNKILLVGDGVYLAQKLFAQNDKNEIDICLAREDMIYQNAFSVARAGICEYENNKDSKSYDDKSLLPTYLRLSQAERERNERLNKNADRLQ